MSEETVQRKPNDESMQWLNCDMLGPECYKPGGSREACLGALCFISARTGRDRCCHQLKLSGQRSSSNPCRCRSLDSTVLDPLSRVGLSGRGLGRRSHSRSAAAAVLVNISVLPLALVIPKGLPAGAL